MSLLMILYKLVGLYWSVSRFDCFRTFSVNCFCFQALDSKKPNSISIFVTHAVFPQESWKKFITTKCGEIKKFWITDSIPHAVEIAKNEPFELISLSESISDCLFGYDLLSHTQ